MAAADELSDPFTLAMIGAWWPAPPAGATAAAAHWEAQRRLKEEEATALDALRTRLAAENSGRTADDLLTRLQAGRNQLRDIADQCGAKSEASTAVARAVDGLRERLRGIAENGRQKISGSLAGDDPLAKKVADINSAVRDAHEAAAGASHDAADRITGSTQQVLDRTTGDDARTALREHGAHLHDVPRPREFTADDVTRALSGGFGFPAGGFPAGGGGGSESGGGFESFPAATPPVAPAGLLGALGTLGEDSSTDPLDADPGQSAATGTPGSPDPDDPGPPAPPPSPSVTPMAGGPAGGTPARTGAGGAAAGTPTPTGPAGPLSHGADLRPPAAGPVAAPVGTPIAAPVAASSPPSAAPGPALAAPASRRSTPTKPTCCTGSSPAPGTGC